MKTKPRLPGRSSTCFLVSILLAACSSPPARMSGDVLVDASGMTLYTFDKDAPGKSACNGPCAVNWPPLKADDHASASGEYSIVTRDDGTKQWAYKGKPLYGWIKDKNPGDKTGDGVNNLWRVAK